MSVEFCRPSLSCVVFLSFTIPDSCIVHLQGSRTAIVAFNCWGVVDIVNMNQVWTREPNMNQWTKHEPCDYNELNFAVQCPLAVWCSYLEPRIHLSGVVFSVVLAVCWHWITEHWGGALTQCSLNCDDCHHMTVLAEHGRIGVAWVLHINLMTNVITKHLTNTLNESQISTPTPTWTTREPLPQREPNVNHYPNVNQTWTTTPTWTTREPLHQREPLLNHG
jgi:hypothetical protein